MRDYVLKVARDKKQELLLTLRDKLIEELKRCEPTRDAIDDEAEDLYTVFSIWGPVFDKIDGVVEDYLARNEIRGDAVRSDREDALETVKRILEL